MKKGFTLIEMLVVIGIIAVLIGASIGGFSKMKKTAERAKEQELVSNVATALTALFQREGCWPKALLNGTTAEEGGHLLDEKAAIPLAKGNYLSLTTRNDEDGRPRLSGLDRCGVLTPEGTAKLKRMGNSSVSSDAFKPYILRYALDADGDGIITDVSVVGEGVRATAIVWCTGKDGKMVQSWSKGQTLNVK